MKHRLPLWMTPGALPPIPPPTRRYLVFRWFKRPAGGFLDFHSSHTSLLHAEAYRTIYHRKNSHTQLVDSATGEIIATQNRRHLPSYSFLRPADHLIGLTALIKRIARIPHSIRSLGWCVPADPARAAKECPSVRPQTRPARTSHPIRTPRKR